MTKPIRLQVALSRSGICSRRSAMDWVKDGRVTVNGEVNREPSTPVVPGKDKITVDGRPLESDTYLYILLYKPKGCTTTKADRFAEKTVLDLLPENLRHLHPVGRLDKDTEGLLILTNDGELTNRLTHPRFHVEKTYQVKVMGRLTPDEQKRLEGGVLLDEKKTLPAQIRSVRLSKGMTEFTMTIREGRKRQIRRMVQEVGHRVTALKRTAQGPLQLGRLRPGEHRRLTAQEVTALKRQTKA